MILTILSHVWNKYKEKANQYGQYNDVKEIYKQSSLHYRKSLCR